jgi:ABC-type nitrate/sulfonate/bicarbonate transport system substrate-binding protein
VHTVGIDFRSLTVPNLSYLPAGRSAPRITATVAAVAAASLAVTACSVSDDDGSSGSDLKKVTLQTSWVPLVQFGGSYIADHEGYYKDNGVDVDIRPGGPDVDAMSAVVSGQADIGMSNADTVAHANAEGADLVIIAAGFQKNPLSLLSSPDKPISNPKDMEGKKIGVPSGDEAAQESLMEHNGVDASKVTTVPASFDIAPLTSGEVDGLWVFYAEQPVSYLEATGHEGNVMMTSDFGFDAYAQVYAVKRETLEDSEKREAVTDFLKGEIHGWQDYVKDPSEAVDLTVNDYAKDSGLSAQNQTEQAKRQMDLLVTPDTKRLGLLQMTDEGISRNVRTLSGLGIGGVSKDMFDTSVLKDAYAGTPTTATSQSDTGATERDAA